MASNNDKDSQEKPFVMCIVGISGSGKTSLITSLVSYFKQRGYRVGTIKHHAHAGFEIDIPGKDTWRFARAGSDHVVLASSGKIATIRLIDSEPSLDEVVNQMTEVDLIFVEGYHWEDRPKLELLRASLSQTLFCNVEELCAVVTDVPMSLSIPVFDFGEIVSIAEWIETQIGNENRREYPFDAVIQSKNLWQ